MGKRRCLQEGCLTCPRLCSPGTLHAVTSSEAVLLLLTLSGLCVLSGPTAAELGQELGLMCHALPLHKNISNYYNEL